MEIDKKKERLFYLDNLKVCLIILVIIHHSAQAYGPTGGFWLFKSSSPERIAWLSRFFEVNASFFMGLFFMISGYFCPGSFDRKGAKTYLKDRFIRLGIPLLFAFFVMMPLLDYSYYINFSGNEPLGYWQYFTHIFLGFGGEPKDFHLAIAFPEWNFGTLWFVEQLLIYSILYAAFRVTFKNVNMRGEGKSPGLMLVFSTALLIAVANALIRPWYPIDVWGRLFGFFQAEAAHLPLYIVLFVMGILAGSKGWFQRMSRVDGFICLAFGATLALIVYGFPRHSGIMKFIGHYWSYYEAFMGVTLVWGLIVLFREVFNTAGTLMRWLAENSFAAYIFHLPVVIVFQYLFDPLTIGGVWAKFIGVSLLSVIVTYALSALVRQIPYVKRVL